MNLIFLAFGIFLISIQVVADGNPFLPVPDDPVPSKGSSQSLSQTSQSKVIIREKAIIQVRPGVRGQRMELSQNEMLINQGAPTDGNNSPPRTPMAVFAEGEREEERVALIPTPLLSQSAGNGRPIQADPIDSLDNQSENDFTWTRNAQGELMLVANRPLPKNGLMVLVKTPNGFVTQILKPVDQEQEPETSNQNILSGVLGEDSLEKEIEERQRERGGNLRNVLKISRDGSFVKISQPNFDLNDPKTFGENSSGDDENSNLIWDPAAGIKATKGKTPQEQLEKDNAQRDKARMIFHHSKVPDSNPQLPILVVSDPNPNHPSAILVSSDPAGPDPILVDSDPHKTLPRPILVRSRPLPQKIPQPSKPLPSSSPRLEEPAVIAKTKKIANANKPKPIPLPQPDQSTETVSKKSGKGMRVDIPKASASFEENN